MRSVIVVIIILSCFFVFADGNAENVQVDPLEVCKSFINERDTYKGERDDFEKQLDQCKTDLAKLQKEAQAVEETAEEVAEEETVEETEDVEEAESVEKTKKIKEKVADAEMPEEVKQEIKEKAEAVYASYMTSDGKTLEKYGELKKFLANYSKSLTKLANEVDALRNQTIEISAGFIVLKANDKIQDKEIVDLNKKIEKLRIKLGMFISGGYSKVEKGSIEAGAFVNIPVAKGKAALEFSAAAGFADSVEMAIVELMFGIPIEVWTNEKITFFVVPEGDFSMLIDALGNSGNEELQAQKGKVFSYSANGAISLKLLFGEYWFIGSKVFAGYSYVIDKENFEEKNAFNLGVKAFTGFQF